MVTLYEKFCNDIVDCKIFDVRIERANDNFLEMYIPVLESAEYDNVFMEKHKATIDEALKIFVAKIVSMLEDLKNAIQNEISSLVQEKAFKTKLNKMKEEIRSKEANGEKTVEMVDFEKIRDRYIAMTNDLKNQVEKISDPKSYLTHFGLDNDINKFNDKLRDYNEELEDLMGKKKKMKIANAIKFIEEETSGSGKIMKSLSDAIIEFKKLEQTVKQVERTEKIVGKNIITKDVIIVKTTSNGFVKFVRKWSSRIIARCVFWFA